MDVVRRKQLTQRALLVRQKESYGPWELTDKGIETQLSKYDANVR